MDSSQEEIAESPIAVNEQVRDTSPEVIENDVKYGFATGAEYLERLDRFNIDPKKATVLEIGPGTAFGSMAVLATFGANVAVSDRWLAPWQNSYHGPYYTQLAKMIEEAYPEADVTGLERMVENESYANGPIKLYKSDAETLNDIEDGSMDIIFSNAVLEHVYDLDAVCKTLYKKTKSKGTNSHQIDFRDHRNFDRPREHLLIESDTFKKMSEANNMEFGSQRVQREYADAFKQAGFIVDLYYCTARADDTYLDDLTPRLRESKVSSYSNLSREDISDLGGLFFMTRQN